MNALYFNALVFFGTLGYLIGDANGAMFAICGFTGTIFIIDFAKTTKK